MIESQILCKCHQKPIEVASVKSNWGIRNRYYCSITGDQIFSFIHMEVNMPDKDNPGTMPPIEEDDETKEAINTVEKPFFTEEELEEERKRMEAEGEETGPEQLSMFEGDKVYKQLDDFLAFVQDEIKKNKKSREKLDANAVILRRKESQIIMAIKDYEEQRSEKIEE